MTDRYDVFTSDIDSQEEKEAEPGIPVKMAVALVMSIAAWVYVNFMMDW